MAWDDTKQADDLIASSEWNTMVTDQKGRVVGTSVNEAIADTSGNLPVAGTSGRIFFETDTGRVLYDNGTSWVEVGLSESQISLANLGSNSHSDLSNITSDDHHTQPSTGTGLSGTTTFSLDESYGATWTTNQEFSSGITISGGDLDDGTNVIFDQGNSWVPISILEHDSVTVAGNTVQLGNSVNVTHSDISNISSNDHHAKYTDEEAQDSVGTILTNAFNYDDATPQISFQPGNVNVTNFDGSSGSSGQFLQTDGTSLSFADVSGGMTNSERQAFNDVVAAVTRNQFEHNLTELAYDGGIFDIFRDESKIASTTNLTVNTLDSGDSNGIIKLDEGSSIIVYDDFEDGDYTSSPVWNEPNNNQTATVQSNTVAKGSNALEISTTSSGGDHTLEHDRGTNDSISDGDIYQCWVRVSDFNTSYLYYYLSNVSADITDGIFFQIDSGSSDFRIRTTQSDVNFGSASTSTWYRVEIEFDVTNSQIDCRVYDINDNLVAEQTGQAYAGNSSFQYVGMEGNNSGSTYYFDDVSYSENKQGKGATSGSFVSTTKDLSTSENGGFSGAPTSLVLSQKVTNLTANNDIQYVARDGNGNTVTLTQSDVDTEVDVSNFTSTVVEIEGQLSRGTVSDANPELDDYMAHFKE